MLVLEFTMDTSIMVYYGYKYQGVLWILVSGFTMDTGIRVYYGYWY